jgi:hypothetical protein
MHSGRRFTACHLGPDGDLVRTTLDLRVESRDQLDRLGAHYRFT